MKKLYLIASTFIIAVLVLSLFGASPAAATPVEDRLADQNKVKWTQDYIGEVPPIMMRDPMLEMFGQVDGPIPTPMRKLSNWPAIPAGRWQAAGRSRAKPSRRCTLTARFHYAGKSSFTRRVLKMNGMLACWLR